MNSEREFYFDSIRLEMGMGGRFFVRLIVYAFYGMLTASVAVLVFAELRWMQSAGILLGLFLIDRVFHVNRADKKLLFIPEKGQVNLFHYLSPATAGILEKSLDKASFLGGNIFLWVVKQSLAQSKIKKSLARFQINPGDIEKKVDELLKESLDLKIRIAKNELLVLIEKLVVAAGQQAVVSNHEYIQPSHLLSGLDQVGDPAMKRLFILYNLSDLGKI